jgi:hypothetical protein
VQPLPAKLAFGRIQQQPKAAVLPLGIGCYDAACRAVGCLSRHISSLQRRELATDAVSSLHLPGSLCCYYFLLQQQGVVIATAAKHGEESSYTVIKLLRHVQEAVLRDPMYGGSYASLLKLADELQCSYENANVGSCLHPAATNTLLYHSPMCGSQSIDKALRQRSTVDKRTNASSSSAIAARPSDRSALDSQLLYMHFAQSSDANDEAAERSEALDSDVDASSSSGFVKGSSPSAAAITIASPRAAAAAAAAAAEDAERVRKEQSVFAATQSSSSSSSSGAGGWDAFGIGSATTNSISNTSNNSSSSGASPGAMSRLSGRFAAARPAALAALTESDEAGEEAASASTTPSAAAAVAAVTGTAEVAAAAVVAAANEAAAAAAAAAAVPLRHLAAMGAFLMHPHATSPERSHSNSAATNGNTQQQQQQQQQLSPEHRAAEAASAAAAAAAAGATTPPHSSAQTNMLYNANADDDGGDAPTEGGALPAAAGVAVSEDMTCVYKGTALESCVIEGRVTVAACSASYIVALRDAAGHIASSRPNAEFLSLLQSAGTAAGAASGTDASSKDVTSYCCDTAAAALSGSSGHTAVRYLNALLYRCSDALRPVPLRVQCRQRVAGCIVRVSVQITANPTLPQPLTGVLVHASIPACHSSGSSGSAPQQPAMKPLGEWSVTKSVATWKIATIAPGEKLLLEAQFQLDREAAAGASLPASVPVQVFCQSPGALFSAVGFRVLGLNGSDSNGGADSSSSSSSGSRVIKRLRLNLRMNP